VCWSWDNVDGRVTCHRLDGSGLDSQWGHDFFAPTETGPGAHPASNTIGTRSFVGVKQPWYGLGYPSPSSANFIEGVKLYLYSPSGPSRSVLE